MSAPELIPLGILTMDMDTVLMRGGPFEPRYAWLNAIQGLAKGHSQGPHARFEVWEPR